MNQQWLTILMSKGIELEQNLRQQLQNTKENIRTQLEEHGLRLSPADLAAVLEEVSPKASHAALSYLLNLIRPFSGGMGLRVSRLSDTQVEMLIPFVTHNLNEAKRLHEGALVTAAIEASKLLWMRHAPLGNFDIQVVQIESEIFREISHDCRIRMELAETTREVVLSEVRDRREAQADVELKVFDENDQTLAGFRMKLAFKHTPALAATGEE